MGALSTGASAVSTSARRACALVPLLLLLAALLGISSTALAQGGGATIELYVDESSGQVFTKPGPGRTRLGTFQRVDTPADAAGVPSPAIEVAPVPPATPAPALVEAAPPTPSPEDDEKRWLATYQKVTSSKWFQKISLRGYVQLRYNALLDKEGDVAWFAPSDRSVADGAGLFIRRGRMIFSGDISDHVYIYIQPDLNALPASGDFSLQLRDLYADVAIDAKKEFRFRLGQSKVPYGWVNLQSSQNRIPLERPEALNSAVEGERDIGVFFYWAPERIRERFRYLVSSGLKGSGDYGVFGLGFYNGQGLNRLDLNNNFHVISRLTYPFELEGGQYIESGIAGYIGQFVPRTAAVGDPMVRPSAHAGGVRDQRLAFNTVVYPQPFGFETEWTIGEGPVWAADDFIDSRFLWGGYAQGDYRIDSDYGILFPFVRWQYYDGGRKFATNAPLARLSEWDFGVEWQVIPELELTTIYTYTPFRTNTRDYPYGEIKDGSRLGLQVQWNY